MFGVNEAQVVGRACYVFTVIKPQLRKQNHQLVVVTHLEEEEEEEVVAFVNN